MPLFHPVETVAPPDWLIRSSTGPWRWKRGPATHRTRIVRDPVCQNDKNLERPPSFDSTAPMPANASRHRWPGDKVKMKHRRQVPQHPSFVQWDQGAFRDDRWRPAGLSPPLVSATPCRRRRGVLSAQDITLKSASTDRSALARIQETSTTIGRPSLKLDSHRLPCPRCQWRAPACVWVSGQQGSLDILLDAWLLHRSLSIQTAKVFAERLIARISSSLLSRGFAAPSVYLFAHNISRRWLFSAGHCCCTSLAFSSLLYPPGWLFALYPFIYPFIFIQYVSLL
jgi:hypothetical protein